MADVEIYKESLEEQANHVLEECRIIVPGIQALIGFQMIAIFNQAFYDRLAKTEQQIHFASVCTTVLAMFCLLAPSAYQRLAEPGEISLYFVRFASLFIRIAMAFLRLAICTDIYLLARAIDFSSTQSACVALALFVISWILWVGFPSIARLIRKSQGRMPS